MGSKASLLDFESSLSDVPKFFSDMLLEIQKRKKQTKVDFLGQVAALLFFESSTRTKLSFATAAVQVGLSPIYFEPSIGGTSMEKGETPLDSILNINALGPRVFVIRCGDNLDLKEIDSKLESPILNAGWGQRGHPTQALLDAATMAEFWGSVRGKKLLIVGDIRHSRVARSHFSLLPKLGMRIGVCAPDAYLPENTTGLEKMDRLSDGLGWCDAVMSLRVQMERHSNQPSSDFESDFKIKYQLNSNSLRALKKDAMILHPGPVNWGIEMTEEIMSDPRTKIMQQVSMGVQVRKTLLEYALGNWK